MARKYNDMSETPATAAAKVPTLSYGPPKPKRYNPPIALIGCGGISETHLQAYREMKLNVVALCDSIPGRADARRRTFFPDAATYTDYREVLSRDDVEVVDLATHPKDREYLIPAALKAHKHVLSQKPFVFDLRLGRKFVDLADRMGVTLAVNQNGRWSPHWSWVRHAVQKKLVGDVTAVHLNCHWNHDGWIRSTHFNRLHHVVLYDYAIHWFDALSTFMTAPAKRVFSTLTFSPGQKSKPPMLGQSVIEYENGSASLIFDGATVFGAKDYGCVIGTKGMLTYAGPSLTTHAVELITKGKVVKPQLTGTWMTQGFMGSMGELLCSIESKRLPLNNANDNLRGLTVCFAAVASAESGRPEVVGKIQTLPVKTCTVSNAG